MNIELVGKIWDGLEERHLDLMHPFYNRLFEHYSRYKPLFPPSMDSHMPRMMQTFATMSRLGDHPEITEAHMHTVGKRHHHFDLSAQDMNNSKEVFLEVIAEFSGDAWTVECAEAWNKVFDTQMLPQMMSGLSATEREPQIPPRKSERSAHWYTYV
ncbi:Globin [Gammaproteobacteria bacterium]